MDIPITEPEHTRWHKRQEIDAKTDELISAGYTFTYQGQSYTFDTAEKALSKLTVAHGVAKDRSDKRQAYAQKMVMKDYKVVAMDRDTILATYDPMIAHGLAIYDQHADLIASLENLTLEELRAWRDPRE